jgi:hypothetical protein
MNRIIISISIIFLFFLNSCGGFKKVDSDVPQNAQERARKNVQEGRGVSIGGMLGGRKGTNYEFSSSNPMWRASVEILDFLPFSVVDYSGGMLITDWYSEDNNNNSSLKITVRFLSNEVRSDSLKIIVHEKKCVSNNNCAVKILNTKIKEELLTSIVKRAATLEKESKTKKK